MSDNLPPEILSRVLQLLPVKTLLRCTAVCKHWRFIIPSPCFIAAHLALSSSHLRPISPYTASLFAPTLIHFRSPKFSIAHSKPARRGFPSFRLVGCVHGLLCLSDDIFGFNNNLIIWKPSIRKFVTLSVSKTDIRATISGKLLLGFGFDSASNDYKMVSVMYSSGYPSESPPVVLRERRWREVVGAPNGEYFSPSQCFIHGAMHWIACRRTDDGESDKYVMIMRFHMGTEVFEEIKLPQTLARVSSPHYLAIPVIGGLLTITETVTKPPLLRHSVRDSGITGINIWTMREYNNVDSWEKVVNHARKRYEIGAVLNWRRVGGVFADLQLPACYVLSNQPNLLIVHNQLYAFTFEESLVLLDRESRTPINMDDQGKKWISLKLGHLNYSGSWSSS